MQAGKSQEYRSDGMFENSTNAHAGYEVPMSKVFVVAIKPFSDKIVEIRDERAAADEAARRLNDLAGRTIFQVFEALIHLRRH